MLTLAQANGLPSIVDDGVMSYDPANGYIYLTSLNDGTVTVLKAGLGKPEVAIRNPALGERVSATPAIADDTVYIRTAGHLYAFAEKK